MKRRLLFALMAWLLVAGQLWADILHADAPGLTLYVRIRTSDTASIAVALTEGTSNAVGYYKVTDAALVTAGLSSANRFPGYTYKVLQGTPSTSANDTLKGYGVLYWTGSVEAVQNVNAEEINTDTASADNLDDAFDESGASGVDLALESLAILQDTGDAVNITTAGASGNAVRLNANAGAGFLSTGGTYGGRFVASAGIGLSTSGTTSHTEGIVDSGLLTADSGGTTTTLVDAALTQADNDWWKGRYVESLSGTTAGQIRRIAGFTASTDTLTFDRAFTAAIGTNTYRILAQSADSNEEALLGTLHTPTVAGVQEVDITHVAGTIVNPVSGAIPSNVTQWNSTNVATPSVAGVPEIDLTHINGAAASAVSGNINANVAAISSDTTAADNLESFMDGTGYAGGTTKLGVNVVQANGDNVMTPSAGILAVNAYQISDDTTAAVNLEAALDGTGYNVGSGQIVALSVTGAVGSVTSGVTVGTMSAASLDQFVLSDTGESAAVAGSVAKLAQGASDPEVFLDHLLGTHPAGSLGERMLRMPNVNAGASGGLLIAGSNAATTFATLTSTGVFSINGVSDVAQTGDSFARIGAAGAGLTAVGWNATWDAEVQSEANDALVANHLQKLFAEDYDPTAEPGVATALLNELVGNDAGVSQFTANTLELGPGTSNITQIEGADATDVLDARILAYGALKPTVASRTLDVTATGAAGIDWANVEAPTTALNLSGTTIQGGGGIDWENLIADNDDIANSFGKLFANLNTLIEADGGGFRYTTNALEQAPSGSQTNPQVLVSTTIASPPVSQTQFVLTAGSTIDGSYEDQAVVFYDANNNDYPSSRTVFSYDGDTKTLTVAAAPDFTVVAGDGIKVFTGGSSSTGTVSSFLVDRDHTWRFDNRNQVTAPNNIGENIGFVGLVAMDFSEPMPALSSISSIGTVTFTDIVGETEPVVVSSAASADKKQVHVLVNAGSATDATYTISVTITTTDSQTFVRKGRLVIQ